MGEQHVKIISDENGLVKSVGNQNEIFETCVICGKLTDTLIDTHIDYRYGYVEGCGQCCRECYDKTEDNQKRYIDETMKRRRTLITISAEDVMNTPNDMELGEKVRKICWEILNPSKSENKWICSICGQDTSNVDYDYLFGTDHISCSLGKEK